MNYAEVMENAKGAIGPKCKVCPVCNGLGCGNTMPGPGSKGPGNGAHENYKAWRNIKVNMDTIAANVAIDTSTQFFGRKLDFPLVSAPIGSIKYQFNLSDDVRDFNEKCLAACENKGLMHFYATGREESVHKSAIKSRIAHNNCGIPVINPEADEVIIKQMNLCTNEVPPLAIGVVVDSAGLPHLKQLGGAGGTKTLEQLATLKKAANGPLIIKGIMTALSALKAVEAGADAIIVSNHGGRVLSDTPATADVLVEIVEAVAGRARIIVDGGIRCGLDMFKALAMGADLCMICRPVLISYYGGGQQGIECYFDKLKAELVDTMYMCGARSIAEISRDMIRI